LKKMRSDFNQTMPRAIWVNPCYEPLTQEMKADYEKCLSLGSCTGLVKRFTKIAYRARLPDGSFVKGEASGLLARIIQHEVDHINGVLFIDKMEPSPKNRFVTYRAR